MKKSIEHVIIINADDYGYNQSTNDGINDLIINRKVNSVSVIINGDAIDSAVKKIKQIWKDIPILRRQLSVGLHFNLTEGIPLSKECLSSNIVQNGQFIGKPKIYDILQKTDNYNNQAIRSEFNQQIRKFIELFGRRPSHIDGHNHVHIIPVVARIIAKQMYQIGIFRTRIPYEDLDNISIKLNNRFLSYAEKSKHIFQFYKIIFTNDFVGLQNFGKLDPSLIDRSLQKQLAKSQKSVQMMCHPAYPSEWGTQWTKSIDRLREKQQLESEQFQRLFQKYSNYGNYYDLKPQIIRLPSILINHSETILIDEIKRNEIEVKMSELGFETYFYRTLQDQDPQMSIQDLKIIVDSFEISVIVQIKQNEIEIISGELDQTIQNQIVIIINQAQESKQKSLKSIKYSTKVQFYSKKPQEF